MRERGGRERERDRERVREIGRMSFQGKGTNHVLCNYEIITQLLQII